ncbi:MAG: hypothetical protein KDD55_03395 [Bdellovibrionales bacterium]|nr:hypothetical protein [Bdellovibrionales bacterium]
MEIIKGKKKRQAPKRDSKKDTVFRTLATFLRDADCEVRRERLKQGAGWRVMSGSCQAFDKKLVFVDSRLDQDEQITFLITRIVELGLELTEEQFSQLPERVAKQLQEAHREQLSSAA